MAGAISTTQQERPRRSEKYNNLQLHVVADTPTSWNLRNKKARRRGQMLMTKRKIVRIPSWHIVVHFLQARNMSARSWHDKRRTRGQQRDEATKTSPITTVPTPNETTTHKRAREQDRARRGAVHTRTRPSRISAGLGGVLWGPLPLAEFAIDVICSSIRVCWRRRPATLLLLTGRSFLSP